MCVLNILVKNLRIFTYFYVFIIPSGFFKSAEVFQKRIFTNTIYQVFKKKFFGFYFTFFTYFSFFSFLQKLAF